MLSRLENIKKKSNGYRCILVVGSHRSGTSALTRCLAILGMRLPTNILDASLTNETGHWEPRRLTELHDQMFDEIGSAWNDWRYFSLNKLTV